MKIRLVRFAGLVAMVVGVLAVASPALAEDPALTSSTALRPSVPPVRRAPEIDAVGLGGAAALLVGGAMLLQSRRTVRARAIHG